MHEPVFRSPVVTDWDICDQVLCDLALGDMFGYFVGFVIAVNTSVCTDFVYGCGGGIGVDDVNNVLQEVLVSVFLHVVGPIEHFLDLIDAALAISCDVGCSFSECDPDRCQFCPVDSPVPIPGWVNGSGYV